MRYFAAASTFAAIFMLAALPAAGAENRGAVAGVDGNAHNPFSSSAHARVFVFVRTDCPITNRYAPELRRISEEFRARGVDFWLVYPDPNTTASAIKEHVAQYSFPGVALRDPRHELVKLAHATTAPEAAVFDTAGKLMYHGRIDDLWVNPGMSRPAAREHDLENAISAVLTGRAPAVAETRAVGCWLADVQ
jgi:DNA-binding transcriptional LysR family regulator